VEGWVQVGALLAEDLPLFKRERPGLFVNPSERPSNYPDGFVGFGPGFVGIGPGFVGFTVGSFDGSVVGNGGTVNVPSKRVIPSISQTRIAARVPGSGDSEVQKSRSG